MPIVVHLVATIPAGEIREAYKKVWGRFDAQQIRHPSGRRSHMAYLTGDALHTADVWESQEDLDAYLRQFGPIADELGVQLAGPPEVGELLDIVLPPRWPRWPWALPGASEKATPPGELDPLEVTTRADSESTRRLSSRARPCYVGADAPPAASRPRVAGCPSGPSR